MFMVLSSWQSHCESSPGSFDECRTATSGCRPKTKPDDLGCESACQGLHPPSPFIIITQPSPKADIHFTVPRPISVFNQPNQLSLAIHLRVGKLITGYGYGHAEQERRVLRNSRPCDKDCWHTG